MTEARGVPTGARAASCRGGGGASDGSSRSDGSGGAPVVVVLLAAGAGTRFGSQKLLVPIGGAPLLWHALEGVASAEALRPGPFADRILVVGSRGGEVESCYFDWERARASASGVPAQYRRVEAHTWAEGLSVSLRTGASVAWDLFPEAWLYVALGDQPSIPPSHVGALVRARDAALDAGGSCAAVGTRFLDAGRVGVPALLSPSLGDAIGRLHGDAGARHLLNREGGVVPGVGAIRSVPLAKAPLDIDTPDDALAFSAVVT